MKRRYKKMLKLVKKLNKLFYLHCELNSYYPNPSELTISFTISEDEGWEVGLFNKIKMIVI